MARDSKRGTPFGNLDVASSQFNESPLAPNWFLLYYFTISVLPLGDATTLLSLNPVITVLAASLFLSERIRFSHTIAAIGSVIGYLQQPAVKRQRRTVRVFREIVHVVGVSLNPAF